MGNGRRLKGPCANPVPSTRRPKKNPQAEVAAGTSLATCALSRLLCVFVCYIGSWLSATYQLQQFQEARFVNGCIVKFSRWTCRK